MAAILRARGYLDARRGQQFAGGGDSPDVIGIPGVHLELKRTERFALYDAVNQARRDSGGRSVPVVAHRCSPVMERNAAGHFKKREPDCRGEWLFVLGCDDFFNLLARAGYGPLTIEDLI